MGKKNRPKQRKKQRDRKRGQRSKRKSPSPPPGLDPALAELMLRELGSPDLLEGHPGDFEDDERMELSVPALERCAPPVFLGAGNDRLADPARTLGLEASEVQQPEAVQAAWRAIASTGDPERTRRATEARDFLLDPRLAVDRRIGVLYPPDPRAYGLPVPPDVAEVARGAPREAAPSRLGDAARLLGQLALYALVAEELEPPTERPPEPSRGAQQDPPMLPFDG